MLNRCCSRQTSRKTLKRHHSGQVSFACPATIDVSPGMRLYGTCSHMKTAKLRLW